MSAVFGVVSLDGAPLAADEIGRMREASARWGPDDVSVAAVDGAAFGRCLRRSTPEDVHDRLPAVVERAGETVLFTAEGRVDNRAELARALELSTTALASIADAELIRRAYGAWGRDAAAKIFGDWSFAAWHPRARRLDLVRDHYGSTALYYAVKRGRCAFASSQRALLALPWVDRRVNELKLAGSLLFYQWHFPQTYFADITALPPAHAAAIDSTGAQASRYWRLEDTPELRISRDRDYVDGLIACFDDAVRCRLRATSPVATTLSAGLDSSSIAVTAAGAIGRARIDAYTWVPKYETERYPPSRITDEGPIAGAIAAHAGNIDVQQVSGEIDPIAAIRTAVSTQVAPVVAPGNAVFLEDMLRRAAKRGAGALLLGTAGNATISWPGFTGQHWKFDVQLLGWPAVLRSRALKPVIPGWAIRAYQRRRDGDPQWPWQYAPINPDAIRRLDLVERLRADADYQSQFRPAPDARTARIRLLRPESWSVGAHEAAYEGEYGLSLRSPTIDTRVMAYCCGVPDRLFGGRDRQERWLIREAMKGRLPESVRLGVRRGVQGADGVMRLRAHAASVEQALAEAENAPVCATLLDFGRMRAVWQSVQEQRGPAVWTSATFGLLLGLQAAIFLHSETA